MNIKPRPSTINASIAGINDKFKIMNKQRTLKRKKNEKNIFSHKIK